MDGDYMSYSIGIYVKVEGCDKYAFMCASAYTESGGDAEVNYRLSNNTIVISNKAIATSEQKSISFNIYKMK